MARGMSKNFISRNRIMHLVLVVAVVLSILAAGIIVVVTATISISNRMMNVEKKELAKVSANVLPTFDDTVYFMDIYEQIPLSGWLFKPESDNPISTILLVHDVRKNKLQFDIPTSDLIEDMLKANYNVFLFDQRNAGESGGLKSGYGYLEWMDLIGAISKVRDITVTKDVILYGVGNGCSTILQALEQLPGEGDIGKEYDETMLDLPFDRSYVKGLILDSPAKMSDDYIRPLVRSQNRFGWLMQFFVPYAIRITANSSDNMNLMTAISRLQIPICILYGDRDTFIGAGTISMIVDERRRLHPNTTMSYVFPSAAYTRAFESNPAQYREYISNFLNTHFS